MQEIFYENINCKTQISVAELAKMSNAESINKFRPALGASSILQLSSVKVLAHRGHLKGKVAVKIPLTQGKFALVDEADCDLISNHKWWATKVGNVFYAGRTTKKAEGKKTTVYMHRVILDLKKGKQADHINGNGLDNRRSNLRLCANQQNQRNQHSIRGTSKYKGVCRDNGAWLARIKVDYKTKHLGRFKNEIDAARTYDEAAIKHFGEFANTNFPVLNQGE